MSRKRDRRGDDVGKGFGAIPSPDDAAVAEDSTPVDLGAVRADDEFIEALLSKPIVPTKSLADYELAGLLSHWRSEIVAEPIGPNPTLEKVEAGIAAAARRRDTQRSLRVVRYVGAAAAAVAIVFGGVSVVAHNAAPGDPLWGVKEVMFGADASSTLALADVEANIDRAAQAFVAGDRPAAEKYLNTAETLLAGVRDTGDKASLQRKIDKVREVWDSQKTSSSTSVSSGSSSVEVPPTAQTDAPTETVTVPRETVTVTPSETTVSESLPPSSEPPTTTVSEPQTSTSAPPTSTAESSVPVAPAG